MADLPRESKLGRLYNKYQSSTKYQLCSSDAEPLTMKELLDMADYECKVGVNKFPQLEGCCILAIGL